MTDIVTAIYELMGKLAEPSVDDDTIKDKVDRIFEVEATTSAPLPFGICYYFSFRKWTRTKTVS